MKRLIVFDFDGVIADSEILANTVLAEFITELGVPTTVEDSLRTFVGKRLPDVLASVGEAIGRPLGDEAAAEFQRRTLARLRTHLREVNGVRQYLQSVADVHCCIASQSSPDRLAVCLDVLGLASRFGTHVYSATLVPRGKPHPDLFLHAAAQFGIDADAAIVIEDSPHGVRAGLAAGMTTIGFLGASHVRPGHRERLMDAGAHHIAHTYDEVASITATIIR